MRETGLRVSELGSLRVQDVDCETGQVRVQSGKGNKSRVTAMGKTTGALVMAFVGKTKLEPVDFLFTAHWAYAWEPEIRKLRARTIKRETVFLMLQARARQCGFSEEEVKLLQSPHGYRHLWATEHVIAETNHILITSMAGWTNPSMVMRYIRRAGLNVHAAGEV